VSKKLAEVKRFYFNSGNLGFSDVNRNLSHSALFYTFLLKS